MTVKCKHGTEVYKFRCPECADAEKGEAMTDTRDVATDAQIAEYREVCESQGGILEFGYDEILGILNRLAASERECEWRGMLLSMSGRFDYDISDDGSFWLVAKVVYTEGGGRVVGWDRPIVTWDRVGDELIPARPSDDVVAKIKEAING